MALPSELVGASHFTFATRGVARMISEDFPEFDDERGAYPWREPGDRPPAKLGELLALHGGVTVVDSGDLDLAVYAMQNPPGVLVAFDGFPAVLPDSQQRQNQLEFIIRVVLRSAPIDESDNTQPHRADMVSAIVARVGGNRFGLGGAGRIPWPADVDPWEGPGPPQLTECLSHGILSATTVGPPSRLPSEGDILRDDMQFTFAMTAINDDGRWRAQRP